MGKDAVLFGVIYGNELIPPKGVFLDMVTRATVLAVVIDCIALVVSLIWRVRE